jgi:hypothetical protein
MPPDSPLARHCHFEGGARVIPARAAMPGADREIYRPNLVARRTTPHPPVRPFHRCAIDVSARQRRAGELIAPDLATRRGE